MTPAQLQAEWLETNSPTKVKSHAPVYTPVPTIPIPTNRDIGNIPRSQYLVFDYDEAKRDYGK